MHLRDKADGKLVEKKRLSQDNRRSGVSCCQRPGQGLLGSRDRQGERDPEN